MRNTFQISADIKKKAYISEPMVTQNDDITFIVNVFDNGAPFSLAGVTTASLANTRMDGTTVVTPGTIINDNTIQFDLGTNETAVPGKVLATVQLYDEDERVSTIAFTYRVVKDPTGSGYVPSENEQTLIEVVLNDGPLVIQQAQDAATYATTQGDYAKQVADENKTRWLNPVATFADIATTYPNPQHGDTVMVTDDGENSGSVYRYENGQWNLTQKHNDLAIADVQNKIGILNEQLAEKVNQEIALQTDYVEMLQNANKYGKGTCHIIYGGSRKVSVTFPINNKIAVTYVFLKNSKDDFMMLQDGYISENTPINAIKYEKNYDVENGTFIKTYPPNYYTTTVGDYIEFDFVGVGFIFNHFADNRGGVWEFDIDNGAYIIQVSTYSDTQINSKDSLVIDSLPETYHKVRATFIGADPLNPPNGGTARGWVSYDDGVSATRRKAIKVLTKGTGSAKKFDVLYPASNKEFAIELRKVGDVDYQFFPEHNSIGTAFKTQDQQLYINGELKDWVGGTIYAEVEKFQLVQKVQCKLPNAPDVPLAEATIIHTITTNGLVEIQSKIKMIERCEIRKGYGIMTPVFNSFANKLISGLGNKYTVGLGDGSKEYYTENDQCFSYLFYNEAGTNGEKNVGLAVRLNDPRNTLRIGKPNRFSSTPYMTWMEHRNSSMSKLYHGVLENYTAEIGEEFIFSASFIIGELPMLAEMV